MLHIQNLKESSFSFWINIIKSYIHLLVINILCCWRWSYWYIDKYSIDIIIIWWCLLILSVRLENSSTKSAHNSLPRFTIERNIAKSCLCNHFRHAGAAATPWTCSRCRFAPPYLSFLINKKTETSHICVSPNFEKSLVPSF
jgi:hypothetical protein